MAEPSSHDGAVVVALMATLDAETSFQVVLAIAVSCNTGRTTSCSYLISTSIAAPKPGARSKTVAPVCNLSARPLVVQNAAVASEQSR